MASASQQFTTVVAAAGRGRVLIPVPFDPATVWGAKSRHHVGGTVAGMRVRGVVEPAGDGFGFTLGLAQFYRRAYLRWIDATKRRPEQRAQRIAEVIQLLEAGRKQRPQS
jgi:hypothetical protein